MDYESERTRQLGCWDCPLYPWIQSWATTKPTPDFVPGDDYSDYLIDIGFGKDAVDPKVRQFWRDTIRENYRGDDGRRRIRMAAINLKERDGLHSRLFDVKCPVMWLHVSIPTLHYDARSNPIAEADKTKQ
jgi:pimeloyl-ACP methyl ester carboxylesterase